MTWQDELQHLDAELAAGRISAEEYRQRRDAVLGRSQNGPSSGGFPQQGPSSGGFPQQGPSSGGFPQQGPSSGGFPQQSAPEAAQPQQQPNPFPPAFSWGDAAQAGQQQGGSEDATQVVPKPVQQGGDSESTQVVNVPPPPPAWGPPPQPWGPQQGWNVAGNVGTPWGDAELPHTTDPGGPDWMRQGPEVFEAAGKPGKGKLIAGLSIGAVLVVVLAVAVVFYVTSSGDSTSSQAQPSTGQRPSATQPPTRTLPTPPPANPQPPANSQEVLVPVAGPPHPWNGALDVPGLQGAKAGLLQPRPVLDFALQNGLVDGWFTGTDGATPRVTMLALHMPDGNGAYNLAQEYLKAQQGLSDEDALSYQGVKVVSAGGTFRTAYVVHSWAVIIDVSGPGEQKQVARDAFKSLLDQQLAHMPPTVRK